jgi:hypothetical protein
MEKIQSCRGALHEVPRVGARAKTLSLEGGCVCRFAGTVRTIVVWHKEIWRKRNERNQIE